jgi:hypothetical protein
MATRKWWLAGYVLSAVCVVSIVSNVTALECPSCLGTPDCDCTCKMHDCRKYEGGPRGTRCEYYDKATCTNGAYMKNGDPTKFCDFNYWWPNGTYETYGKYDATCQFECSGCLNLNQPQNAYEGTGCEQGEFISDGYIVGLCVPKPA